MIALVVGILLGLLREGGDVGPSDTIEVLDTNHTAVRNAQEVEKQGSIRTAPAESLQSVFALNFPDGSVEEISAQDLTAYLRRNPLCRRMVLGGLLFSLPPRASRRTMLAGLSGMLPRRPPPLTAFEQMSMTARRYEEVHFNPALRMPSAQIDLFRYVVWLFRRLW